MPSSTATTLNTNVYICRTQNTLVSIDINTPLTLICTLKYHKEVGWPLTARGPSGPS